MPITATRWTAAEDKWKQNLSSTSSASATSLGVGTNGINGTDIAFPIQINSSRWLYLLGDTWWPTAAGQIRVEGKLVHNAVGLQVGSDLSSSTLTFYTSGSVTEPWPYFVPHAWGGMPNVNYPMCGLRIDEFILVLGMAHVGGGGPAGTSPVGPWATMLHGDIDSGTPDQWVKLDVPLRNWGRTRAGGQRVNYHFQSGIADPGDGFIYVWCHGPWNGTGIWVPCRFDRNSVKAADMESPQWWDGDSGWVYDFPDKLAPRRRRNRVTPAAVKAEQGGAVQLRSDGQYQMSVIPGTNGSFYDPDPRVNVGLSSTPAASFSSLSEVYDIPMAANGTAGHPATYDFCYSAYTAPGQTWTGMSASDQLMVYSRNNYNPALTAFTDAQAYWPEFLKVSGL